MCLLLILELWEARKTAALCLSQGGGGDTKALLRIPSNCVLKEITWEANDDCKLVRGLTCSGCGAQAVPPLASGSALSKCWS